MKGRSVYLSKYEHASVQPKALMIINEINKTIIGKDEVIEKVLMAILAKGHILVEDTPGVGKTTLALAFSKTMGLDYKRIQFTPEIMPADVVGFSVYSKDKERLLYQPGAVLCNLLLVDEINRASSKTQSALLEAMEEGSVTVDGVTRQLPNPFVVIATQNPIGSTGTQMLPESQMDRFMVKLSMGYPEFNDEIKILKNKQARELLKSIEQSTGTMEIIHMQEQVENVHIDDDIYVYIARLATATREHQLIRLGVSPRGSIALVRMSKAAAWLAGRDYVIPSDVQLVFFDVFEHRIILNNQISLGNATVHSILLRIRETVLPPDLSRKRASL
jgi:MoxR-like ATPase